MPAAVPLRTRRAPRALTAAVVTALLVAGCGDDDDQSASQVTTTTTSTAVDDPTTTTSSSTTSTSSTTTTSTTTAPTTTVPFDGGTARVEVPRPASTQEVVSHTAITFSGAEGEDRITFAFDGALPGVVVEYVDRPVRESGSGDEVAVAGAAVLAVRFEPASSARIDGEQVTRTYTGGDRVPGPRPGGALTEMVRIGDFEAVYEWVLGLTAEVPFRVEVDEGADTVTIALPAG